MKKLALITIAALTLTACASTTVETHGVELVSSIPDGCAVLAPVSASSMSGLTLDALHASAQSEGLAKVASMGGNVAQLVSLTSQGQVAAVTYLAAKCE